MYLTKRLKRLIKDWALHSLYRLNSGSADCYAFNLCYNTKGKLDFEGGWDWSTNLIAKNAIHIFMLQSQEFIKL